MNKVGIAYPAFYWDFWDYFPTIERVIPREMDKYKLIIFSGGADISPSIYGEENIHSFPFPERDRVELPILKTALELGTKILGVCRGHQLINAYLGGRLIQDLSYLEDHDYFHNLEFMTKKSLVETFFIQGVNSLHHQGVILEGSGLEITSKHKGVIESTESENIITVQFHPEFMDARAFFQFIKEWADV